jgi:hypothetical protein
MFCKQIFLAALVLISFTSKADIAEASELIPNSTTHSPFWTEVRNSLHSSSLLEQRAGLSKGLLLLILPSFKNPIEISLIHKDDKWQISYSKWSRQRKTDKVDFPIVSKRTVIVSEENAEKIFTSLINLGFWNAPAEDSAGLAIDDGAEWLLEVQDLGRDYRALSRAEGGQFKPVYALLKAQLDPQ